MPPGLGRVTVAAAGAVALAAGLVAALQGILAGIPVAAGGALLVGWSISGS
ncbi:MAG TPA: hypothetical protein VM049_10440 [Gaiellaceae bacterium]|nr:hypothetical protein [Gaiellaceae bacterium]